VLRRFGINLLNIGSITNHIMSPSRISNVTSQERYERRYASIVEKVSDTKLSYNTGILENTRGYSEINDRVSDCIQSSKDEFASTVASFMIQGVTLLCTQSIAFSSIFQFSNRVL
jgi:hypothetical protein